MAVFEKMPTIVVLIILQILAVQVNASSLLPLSHTITEERFTCPEDGFFPSNEDECVKSYFNCVGGEAYPEDCPGDLVFDPITKNCVKPERCSVTPAPTSSTTTIRTTTPINFKCPSPNGFYPIPGYCGSDYYLCIGGFPYVETCPPSPNGETSIFDPITMVCTPASEASCYSCPEPNGFFNIPGSCGPDYYNCVNGSPYVETCPAGTIFDPDVLICRPPELVACSGSSEIFDCPRPDGRFPFSDDACTGCYYNCINNIPYILSCPGTSIFDPIYLVCVAADDATCEPSGEPTKCDEGAFVNFNRKASVIRHRHKM